MSLQNRGSIRLCPFLKPPDNMAPLQDSLVRMDLRSLLAAITEEDIPPRLTILAERLPKALGEQETKKPTKKKPALLKQIS
jgi:hypothetical protein